jgi:hypothetical protein
MDSFIETPRFPTHISIGSGGGPKFKTFTFAGHSAVESVQPSWTVAKGTYEIDENLRDKTDFDIKHMVQELTLILDAYSNRYRERSLLKSTE